MNLICFPHYTCGGLLCDILNDTFSPVHKNGGIASIAHSLGKIGDADTVLTDYDQDLLFKKLQSVEIDKDHWVGTHCWPGNMDLAMFDQVLVISTATARSKLYRWIRAYYLYYQTSQPWIEVDGQDRIDKERETAKNYLKAFDPVKHDKVTNIEFADVVEETTEFKKIMDSKNIAKHMDRWKSLNHFLYANNIWNSAPFQRFYEAEVEIALDRHYIYE